VLAGAGDGQLVGAGFEGEDGVEAEALGVAGGLAPEAGGEVAVGEEAGDGPGDGLGVGACDQAVIPAATASDSPQASATTVGVPQARASRTVFGVALVGGGLGVDGAAAHCG
jgi:hypothetical protein